MKVNVIVLVLLLSLLFTCTSDEGSGGGGPQLLTMTGVSWGGYSASSLVIEGLIAHPNDVTGIPDGGEYSYSTTTPDKCSIDGDTGEVWGLDLGTCRITVTVRAPGYNDLTLPEANIAIERGGIMVGSSSSCALLSDGQVKCWGGNSNGQLGQGNTDDIGDGANEMGIHLASVDLGSGLNNRPKLLRGSSGTGSASICALFDDGRIKCWGHNSDGQLGHGDTDDKGNNPGEMGDALPYTDLGTGAVVRSLSLGSNFSCALLDSGQVKCWGKNDYGQLGLGHTDSIGDETGEMGETLSTVNLGTGRTAKEVSSGRDHVCALLDNGTVKCWGRNDKGQLGQGDTADRGGTADDMASLEAVDFGRQSYREKNIRRKGP